MNRHWKQAIKATGKPVVLQATGEPYPVSE